MKQCSKCKEVKGFEEFGKRKASKDGLRSDCKECRKQYQRENQESIREYRKQYRQENRELLNEKDKIYRQENKEYYCDYKKQYRQENKELISEKLKSWYEENKESVSERSKQYRQENKELISERRKKRYEENKELILEKLKQYHKTEKGREVKYKAELKRRSTKHKVNFKPHERKAILDRDNWTCQECGITVHDRRTGDWNTHDKAHIDHIKPISKGGDSTPQNLQTLCRTCNLSKSNKMTG